MLDTTYEFGGGSARVERALRADAVRTAPGKGAAVLVLGNTNAGLAAARRLAGMGYRVIISRDGGAVAQRSRFVRECWDHPPATQPATFLEALRTLLERRPEIQVVLPVWEPMVLCLARFRDRLPVGPAYLLPDPDVVLACLDRIRLLTLAGELGLPMPSWTVVTSYSAMEAAARRIGTPVVLRSATPLHRIAGQRALVCQTQQSLSERLPRWPDGHRKIIVQRHVGGRRHQVQFAAAHGRLMQLVATETWRTNTADGTGRAVRGRTVPVAIELQAHLAKLTERLSYHGVGAASFQVDRRTGAMSFLDLSPRLSGTHSVARAAGIDFAEQALGFACQSALARDLETGRAGVRFASTDQELQWIGRSVSSGEMSLSRSAVAIVSALGGALLAPHHLTWRWHDPLPALASFLRRI